LLVFDANSVVSLGNCRLCAAASSVAWLITVRMAGFIDETS
jgi:hypothetical protein